MSPRSSRSASAPTCRTSDDDSAANLPKLTAHIESLSDADLNAVAARVRNEQSQDLAGFELSHEDLLVDTSDREGFLSGAEGIYSLALNTEITTELAREGLARELVRHLQELRRTAGLDVSDRIRAYVSGDSELVADALTDFGDYVRQETLSIDILQSTPSDCRSHQHRKTRPSYGHDWGGAGVGPPPSSND